MDISIIENVPESPGVYIFKNKRNVVIYVGKAKNLRKRVKGHFEASSRFLKDADSLRFIITNNEEEALLLEANLIKKYRPHFNIRLKDDKKYPYIAITVNDTYPRIFLTRNLLMKNVEIYGPYVNAGVVRQSLKILREIFPLRNCKYKLPSSRKINPCIEYRIGLCPGPCIPGKITPYEYRENVENIRDVLHGRSDYVIGLLVERMEEAARDLKFEEASRIRDRIRDLRKLKDHAYIISRTSEVKDVIGLAIRGNTAYFYLLFYRNGRVNQTADFRMKVSKQAEAGEVLRNFLIQYYSTIQNRPPAVVVPFEFEDMASVEKALSFKILVKDASFSNLLKIANTNAEHTALSEKLKKGGRVHPAVSDIKNIFGLDCLPSRIECIDISQLFGTFRVASLVVFENGRPSKRFYRRYRIKTKSARSDFDMVYEVTKRRFARLQKEGGNWPCMFVIDGGSAQLTAALRAREELGIKNVFFAAFAKRFDDFYLENGRRLMLPANSFAMRLMKHLRDEAHRFAITYHRHLRKKGMIRDSIDGITGIGMKRKALLIKYFGTIDNVKTASIDELMKLPGIGKKLAVSIYNQLKGMQR